MSEVRGDEIRTEFRVPRGPLWQGLFLSAAGAGLVVWLMVSAFTEGGPAGRANRTLLLILGVALVVVGGRLLSWGFSRFRLAVDTRGVHVRWRWREATFGWDDVDTWWVGIPLRLEAGSLRELRRVMRESPRTRLGYTNGPVLMLKPATRVDHPAQGMWQLHWAPRQGRWITTAKTRGSPAEIVRALERFAPDKAGREPGHRITS